MAPMMRKAGVGRICWRALAIVTPVALVVAGCKPENEYKPPPPPVVSVTQPVKQTVIDYLYVTGNAQSVQYVTLVARVEGYLDSYNFKDGTIVKQGDLLFVIEPEPYEAKLRQAEATVETQRAALLQAQLEYERQLRLIKDNATSQANVEKWRAQRDSAKADVDNALANEDIARINLGYTRVVAPFNGRIGQHMVDPGNLVGNGAATKLANLEQLDPIYIYFNLNEIDVERVRASLRQRGVTLADLPKIPVFIGLQTEEGYPHQGTLDFVATGIDPNTGTLQARAVVPNGDLIHVLLPGAFVRVRVPIGKLPDSLMVSDRAIGTNQTSRYLLVVDKDNVVQERQVEIGTLINGMRVITKGIAADDWVVADGIQRAIPGSKVNPQRVKAPSVAAAAPAPAGAAKTGSGQ
jgi:RND family efflux transporter MFP subunit